MRKKTFLKIMELQTEAAQKHLDEVRSIYTEMRGYKHDFHHHLQTLQGQLEAGEYDRALRYIEELDENLQHVDTLIKTGNISADAILSAKLTQAREKKIEVTIKAQIPDRLAVSDVELGIILGNLLDNALEACEKAAESERFIRIYCKKKGNMLYFSMINGAREKQKKHRTLFLTQKSGLHGFGLKRVENIIESHDGWCKYNSEDGAFTTEFLLPVEE